MVKCVLYVNRFLILWVVCSSLIFCLYTLRLTNMEVENPLFVDESSLPSSLLYRPIVFRFFRWSSAWRPLGRPISSRIVGWNLVPGGTLRSWEDLVTFAFNHICLSNMDQTSRPLIQAKAVKPNTTRFLGWAGVHGVENRFKTS